MPGMGYLPPVEINGKPTTLDAMSMKDLAVFIPYMMRCTAGSKEVGWGKADCRPPWWPRNQPWTDITKMKPTGQETWMDMLKNLVIKCYTYYGSPDMLSTNGSFVATSSGASTNQCSLSSRNVTQKNLTGSISTVARKQMIQDAVHLASISHPPKIGSTSQKARKSFTRELSASARRNVQTDTPSVETPPLSRESTPVRQFNLRNRKRLQVNVAADYSGEHTPIMGSPSKLGTGGHLLSSPERSISQSRFLCSFTHTSPRAVIEHVPASASREWCDSSKDYAVVKMSQRTISVTSPDKASSVTRAAPVQVSPFKSSREYDPSYNEDHVDSEGESDIVEFFVCSSCQREFEDMSTLQEHLLTCETDADKAAANEPEEPEVPDNQNSFLTYLGLSKKDTTQSEVQTKNPDDTLSSIVSDEVDVVLKSMNLHKSASDISLSRLDVSEVLLVDISKNALGKYKNRNIDFSDYYRSSVYTIDVCSLLGYLSHKIFVTDKQLHKSPQYEDFCRALTNPYQKLRERDHLNKTSITYRKPRGLLTNYVHTMKFTRKQKAEWHHTISTGLNKHARGLLAGLGDRRLCVSLKRLTKAEIKRWTTPKPRPASLWKLANCKVVLEDMIDLSLSGSEDGHSPRGADFDSQPVPVLLERVGESSSHAEIVTSSGTLPTLFTCHICGVKKILQQNARESITYHMSYTHQGSDESFFVTHRENIGSVPMLVIEAFDRGTNSESSDSPRSSPLKQQPPREPQVMPHISQMSFPSQRSAPTMPQQWRQRLSNYSPRVGIALPIQQQQHPPMLPERFRAEKQLNIVAPKPTSSKPQHNDSDDEIEVITEVISID